MAEKHGNCGYQTSPLMHSLMLSLVSHLKFMPFLHCLPGRLWANCIEFNVVAVANSNNKACELPWFSEHRRKFDSSCLAGARLWAVITWQIQR